MQVAYQQEAKGMESLKKASNPSPVKLCNAVNENSRKFTPKPSPEESLH